MAVSEDDSSTTQAGQTLSSSGQGKHIDLHSYCLWSVEGQLTVYV
jgi:hypothetical protein